jgi:hypothetical protein
MSGEEEKARAFSRWPLLLAALVTFGVGIGLDLRDDGTYAVAATLIGLGAASFGAFIYAEGARHRDWLRNDRQQEPTQEDQP